MPTGFVPQEASCPRRISCHTLRAMPQEIYFVTLILLQTVVLALLCYFRGSKGPSDAGPRHRASAEESQRPVHPHEHVYLSGSKNSARGSARGPGGGRPGGLGARAPGGISSHGCPKRHGGPGSSSYLRRNVGACSPPRIPKAPKLHVRAHEKNATYRSSLRRSTRSHKRKHA